MLAKTYDNYNNPVIETYKNYELVKDTMGGWYVNGYDGSKRNIVAKFPVHNVDESVSQELAFTFWGTIIREIDWVEPSDKNKDNFLCIVKYGDGVSVVILDYKQTVLFEIKTFFYTDYELSREELIQQEVIPYIDDLSDTLKLEWRSK